MLFFITATFVFPFLSYGQGVNFELVYGTQNYDDAKCIIQTLDSGYVVAGSTSGFGDGMSDVYLTKISKTGNVIWQQAIGGAGVEKGNSVIQTPDSGFAVVGYTNSSGNGGYDVYLVRTDKNGKVLWAKTYGGTDWDFGNSIIRTKNGDYVIAGSTYSYGNGNEDVYLVKTDSTGKQLWDLPFGGASEDEAKSVAESTDGGYFITGYTKSFGNGNEDVYLLKTDSDGSLQWTKTYGGAAEDIGSEGKQTRDGGYIVIASTKSFETGKYFDYWLLKTDSVGDTLNYWTRRESAKDDKYATSVCQTYDGGYIFTGHVGISNFDIFLFKTDASGWWQNYRTYGGTDVENAFSVKQTFDSGYVVVGTTNSYGGGYPNIYVLKTGSDLTSTGIVQVVVGVEEIKYSNNKVVIYPKPAFDHIQINSDARSVLEIFDSMGKSILLTQLSKETSFIDVSYLPNGIYFALISNGEYNLSDKIIIQH